MTYLNNICDIHWPNFNNENEQDTLFNYDNDEQLVIVAMTTQDQI